MINEPLGLPKGSVRAILILIITIFLFFCFAQSLDIPEQLLDFWIALVSFYFGLRAEFLKEK
jgi:hypothetical protein